MREAIAEKPTMADLAGAIVNLLPDDLDEKRIRNWLAHPDSLKRTLQSALTDENFVPLPDLIQKIRVDYNAKPEEVARRGGLTIVRPTHDFLAASELADLRETAEITIRIIHFGRTVDTDDILRLLELQGDGRPPETIEFAHYLAERPETFAKRPLVLPRAVTKPGTDIAAFLYAYTTDEERRLDTRFMGSFWNETVRFMIVKI